MKLTYEIKVQRRFLSETNQVAYVAAYTVDELQDYVTDKTMLAIAEQFIHEAKQHDGRYWRFVMFCPDLPSVLLGFEVKDVARMDEAIRCKHFNYHPSRKGLVETHEMHYPDAGYGDCFVEDKEFIKAFTHTFATLGQLVSMVKKA